MARMLFYLLAGKISCSAELSMNFFYNPAASIGVNMFSNSPQVPQLVLSPIFSSSQFQISFPCPACVV